MLLTRDKSQLLIVDVQDKLLGAILAHTFVPTAAGRARPVDRIVDLVVRLVRPTA
mgnify:CR=1 FL=1